MYPSVVCSRDMGLLSVRESGLGIGILCVCFDDVGSSLCMSMNCMICSIRCVHTHGSLPSMLSVKPPLSAFFGVAMMSLCREVVKFGHLLIWSYVYGHARFGCSGGIWNMGAMSRCASMMRCCICVLSLCSWGMYSCRFVSVKCLLGFICTPYGPVSSFCMDTKCRAFPGGFAFAWCG